MFRAYEYGRIGALSRKDVDRIFRSYVGTLKIARPMIDALSTRGYPNDFVGRLKREIDESDPPTRLDLMRRFVAEAPSTAR